MARVNTNKVMDAMVARREVRLAQENDRDFNFLVEVLEGRVLWIGEAEKERFARLYKKLLEDGQYLVRREGHTVLSSKYPEKLERQRAGYADFMKNIFIQN